MAARMVNLALAAGAADLQEAALGRALAGLRASLRVALREHEAALARGADEGTLGALEARLARLSFAWW